MGTVTYPEATVVATLEDRFVGCQINTQDGTGDAVVERYRQVWTPDLRVLDADGFELYGWNGYLPPYEFLAQLLVGQGHAYLRLHDEPGAESIFGDVLTRFPTSQVAAEAQYFQAVAAYKRSHEGGELAKGWHHLRTKYPDSAWRLRQSFTEKLK